MQREFYNEEQLTGFLHTNRVGNHFEYIIQTLEKSRDRFNHRPYVRRTEQSERFRTATENLLQQVQGSSHTRQQDRWAASSLTAVHYPAISSNTNPCQQIHELSSFQHHRDELQRGPDQNISGEVGMLGQYQQNPYNPHAFLKPQATCRVSANVFRAQNCSSQTSMRSGTSSNSFVDIDAVLTPSTSQDGHFDACNGTSSASSSLHQKHDPASSLPVLTIDPMMMHPVAWDGRITYQPQGSNKFSVSLRQGDMAEQDTGSWPGSHYGLNPVTIEPQPEVPETWGFSQDPSNFDYSNQAGPANL